MALIAAKHRSPLTLLLFVVCAVTLCTSRGWADSPQVAIGLQSGQTSVFVSSSQPFFISEPSLSRGSGRTLVQARAGSLWRVDLQAASQKPAIAVFDAEGRRVAAVPGVHVAAASDATVRLWSAAAYKSKGRGKAYRGVLIVRARGRSELQVINPVNLEDYVRGVVPAEMAFSSPPEALKAQAIAARSEALAKSGRHKADGFDLCATEHCQSYGGADSEQPSTTQAVHDTQGIVLTYQGKIVDAVYCTNCGGVTANSEDVWLKHPVPYLRSVACGGLAWIVTTLAPIPLTHLDVYYKSPLDASCKPPDGNAKNFRWTRAMAAADIERWANARKKIGKLVNVTVLERALGGRVKRLAIDGEDGVLMLAGDWTLRQFFRGLPSSAFIVEPLPDAAGKLAQFKLWGAGWGHGVGMCQEGAIALARNGWSCEQILKHYFTGVDITAGYGF